jgi:hypothetical protein
MMAVLGSKQVGLLKESMCFSGLHVAFTSERPGGSISCARHESRKD